MEKCLRCGAVILSGVLCDKCLVEGSKLAMGKKCLRCGSLLFYGVYCVRCLIENDKQLTFIEKVC